jgi:hypothetical protein
MRTDPIGQPVIHGANVQIDGLDAAEGAFHAGVGRHLTARISWQREV